MDLLVTTATEVDAAAIAAVHTAAAQQLTRRHGPGHWSSTTSPVSVVRAIQSSTVLVGIERGRVVATLRLATRQPWAIDPRYFVPVRRPLYLLDMAVAPHRQGRGFGRRLIEYARVVARSWPGDALRLDAYDAAAGAGGFYEKCGFHEVGRVVYRDTPLIYYELLLAPPLSDLAWFASQVRRVDQHQRAG
ncbi:MAG: GNAT family N-acetyltransferase [Micromonosporaceae bacterium]